MHEGPPLTETWPPLAAVWLSMRIRLAADSASKSRNLMSKLPLSGASDASRRTPCQLTSYGGAAARAVRSIEGRVTRRGTAGRRHQLEAPEALPGGDRMFCAPGFAGIRSSPRRRVRMSRGVAAGPERLPGLTLRPGSRSETARIRTRLQSAETLRRFS